MITAILTTRHDKQKHRIYIFKIQFVPSAKYSPESYFQILISIYHAILQYSLYSNMTNLEPNVGLFINAM